MLVLINQFFRPSNFWSDRKGLAMPRHGANIYRRKDRRWEGRIETGKYVNGKRRYRSVYGKTYAEVKKRMETLRAEIALSKEGRQYTMEEALDIWMKERGAYWKKTTYATYSHMTSKYILPFLGETTLECIDEGRMEEFLLDIQKEKELSIRYLRSICAVVLRTMNHMKKRHHYKIEVPENPLSPGKQGERAIPRERDLAILEQYLMEQAVSGEETCLGILTALYTGLRIGEICALTWEDIDLRDAVIHVRRNLQRVKICDGQKNNTVILLQTPKSESSCRTIPIPPVLMPLLKKQVKKPDCYLIRGRRSPWAEPRTLQYRFVGILKACGLERFNFHMLRHAFATRCIAEGFDVKSLSEILGHSSIQITLNLYIHSSMQRKRQLMGQISDSFYAC